MQSAAIPSNLATNIFPSIPLPHAIGLCSSPYVRDQVSHPHLGVYILYVTYVFITCVYIAVWMVPTDFTICTSRSIKYRG